VNCTKLKVYIQAIKAAFGLEIDYAMLIKIYGESVEGQKRYRPAECLGCKKETIKGMPDLGACQHVLR
jgi:hypothetical protein